METNLIVKAPVSVPIAPLKWGGLHYRWDGCANGPVLVLSHSLGASLEMWEPQVAAFGGKIRILRYDHRGHGQSGLPEGPWTMDDFGRDVLGLLDHLNLDRVHFCGLSLGGMVGLWLGQNAADRIGKMVLCNCSATIEDPSLLRGRMALIEREGLTAIADNVLDRWFTSGFREANPEQMAKIREMILATKAEGYLRTCETLCDFDLRPGLGEIAAHSLVIWGRHDQATPPEWTRAFAEKLPNGQTRELESAHLSNIEAAKDFNWAVGEFLQ